MAKTHENTVAETSVKTTSQKAVALIAAGGRNFKVKKQVTKPVLSQVDNEQYIVRFDTEIKQAPEVTGGKPKLGGDGLPLPNPMIAEITDLQTGQLMTLVVGKVLQGELERGYPDREYVGLSFALRSKLIAKKGDAMQKMRVYDIVEVDEGD